MTTIYTQKVGHGLVRGYMVEPLRQHEEPVRKHVVNDPLKYLKQLNSKVKMKGWIEAGEE